MVLPQARGHPPTLCHIKSEGLWPSGHLQSNALLYCTGDILLTWLDGQEETVNEDLDETFVL